MEEVKKLPSPQARHLMEPLSGSSASLLQGTQPPRSTTQGDRIQGKGRGNESLNSSIMTMQKFKSLLMDLPTSIYMFLKR